MFRSAAARDHVEEDRAYCIYRIELYALSRTSHIFSFSPALLSRRLELSFVSNRKLALDEAASFIRWSEVAHESIQIHCE